MWYGYGLVVVVLIWKNVEHRHDWYGVGVGCLIVVCGGLDCVYVVLDCDCCCLFIHQASITRRSKILSLKIIQKFQNLKNKI